MTRHFFRVEAWTDAFRRGPTSSSPGCPRPDLLAITRAGEPSGPGFVLSRFATLTSFVKQPEGYPSPPLTMTPSGGDASVADGYRARAPLERGPTVRVAPSRSPLPKEVGARSTGRPSSPRSQGLSLGRGSTCQRTDCRPGGVFHNSRLPRRLPDSRLLARPPGVEGLGLRSLCLPKEVEGVIGSTCNEQVGRQPLILAPGRSPVKKILFCLQNREIGVRAWRPSPS